MATVKNNPDSVMSVKDQQRVQYYRDIYNKALANGDKDTMDAAHKAVEDIRQGYGYSGGADGSQYITEGIEAPAGNYMDAGLDAESQKTVDNARLNYYIALGKDDTPAMNYWHQVAENERKDYGYSGGDDGSEYIALKKPTSGSTTSVPTAPVAPVEPEVPKVVLPEMPTFAELNVPKYTAMEIPAAPDVKINDYSQYIQEMQQAQLDATLAEYEQAYRKNVNAIDRAGVGVDEAYQGARNRTAGAADLANRNFAEVANASGLNSGTGGQAALARSVALQDNMNALNLQEAQSLADLEQQRADNTVWYDTVIAQATAQGKQQEAELLYQEKIRVESATVEAIQQKFANEVTAYQLQMDAAQQQFDDEVTKKQLEYQALRDSVADAQWLAQFDMAYNQWLQDVEMQYQQLQFAREQWVNEVEIQKAQLDMQKESLDAELEQMDVSNNQWQQSFDTANDQWQQEFDASMDQWKQSFDASMDQYWDNQVQQDWENKFTQKQYDDAKLQQDWENTFAERQYTDAMTASDAYKAVNEDLVAMVKAGANQTEIRAALRAALNEGILTQTEYEQLCAAYTPGWRT